MRVDLGRVEEPRLERPASQAVHWLPARERLASKLPRRFFSCTTCRRTQPETEFLRAAIGATRIADNRIYYYPDCRDCITKARRVLPQHPLWTPDLGLASKGAIKRARAGAAQRRLVVVVTQCDVIQMFFDQRGECALSGVPLEVGKLAALSPKANRRSLSIDRIDSAKNYTRDNIQLVCQAVNYMKGTMSNDEFRFWCAKVVLNGDDEDEE